jgi:predicted RNase H-like HicB family nuclease
MNAVHPLLVSDAPGWIRTSDRRIRSSAGKRPRGRICSRKLDPVQGVQLSSLDLGTNFGTKFSAWRQRPDGRATVLEAMAASVDFTIAFDNPDEAGWIVARVLEVPGAVSQGRSREEARENVLGALQTVLTPDEELAGEAAEANREHLRFTAAA